MKVLFIRPPVTPLQGAEILSLCRGIQELMLQTITNLPNNQNPLRAPLNALQLTALSLDLASIFYGPVISLSDLPLLHRVERLYLSNGWVARRSLHIGIPQLFQLTHISFPVQPPGQQDVYTEILTYMLDSFHALHIVILWHMPYQESRVVYSELKKRDLVDPRIVIFNTARFAECVGSENNMWELVEIVVQWQQQGQGSKKYLMIFSSLTCADKRYHQILSVTRTCLPVVTGHWTPFSRCLCNVQQNVM